MKEIKNIVTTFDELDLSKRKLALATVVRVRGSSYRSPGARMLIRDDGRWIGSISGGCLEGDALRKARKVMREGIPHLEVYDTMDDENNSLGVGLGCNGIIDVLIEPIDTDIADHPVEWLRKISSVKDKAAMATVFSSSHESIAVGSKVCLREDGSLLGGSDLLGKVLLPDLKKVLQNNKAAVNTYLENQLEVFIEILEPSINLVIFGAGFDARPVTSIAHTLGWNVTVSDECIAHIAPANFPEADQVVFCKRDEVHVDMSFDPYTAAVLMSHSYEYDLSVLRQILPTSVEYIGILGPKKRYDKMVKALKKEGITLSGKDKGRIHSPVGLDIGAETPEEIALSIVTEIQAVFRNRSGGLLKYREAPIHHRDGPEDQVFKQVFLRSEREYGNNQTG
jgi:xanthine/CO dehydrogenase XdhC/CoxF family maturation factor